MFSAIFDTRSTANEREGVRGGGGGERVNTLSPVNQKGLYQG